MLSLGLHSAVQTLSDGRHTVVTHTAVYRHTYVYGSVL